MTVNKTLMIEAETKTLEEYKNIYASSVARQDDRGTASWPMYHDILPQVYLSQSLGHLYSSYARDVLHLTIQQFL
ncbi:hypothetical protein NQ317_005789 [Molorchus minor]|uniref:Uncharacterized protein n=1 Tax=Molorchus minor TaxID=1323400 RepID=A0ABQ9JG88_9CUCU|nr:hypothetical protein NQ317_005789 [Molorchus minor]